MLPSTYDETDTCSILVGIDEAGRGPLIGSVCAAAVIWPQDYVPENKDDEKCLNMIKDSKKLSEKNRDKLADFIKKNAVAYGVGCVDNKVIDQINILNATFKAMHIALDEINTQFDKIYVDGNRFKTYLNKQGDFMPHTCLIEGDNKLLQIAAASILAKTYRDKMVIDLSNSDPKYEVYGWNKNKGYGTKQHMDAILSHGLTEHHRVTFCKSIVSRSSHQ